MVGEAGDEVLVVAAAEMDVSGKTRALRNVCRMEGEMVGMRTGRPHPRFVSLRMGSGMQMKSCV